MAIIYESKTFIVESHEKPFVDYEDGGHIRIRIKDEFKNAVTDRTKLDPKQAIEYIRLSMVVGEALENIMNQKGIPVIRVNYQEMGNRYAKESGGKPFLHEHIFGRSKDAKKQPRPESVYLPDRATGFYEGFRPLPNDRIELMREKIEEIYKQDKYRDENWTLK